MLLSEQGLVQGATQKMAWSKEPLVRDRGDPGGGRERGREGI